MKHDYILHMCGTHAAEPLVHEAVSALSDAACDRVIAKIVDFRESPKSLDKMAPVHRVATTPHEHAWDYDAYHDGFVCRTCGTRRSLVG
jgi:hypothetical protein